MELEIMKFTFNVVEPLLFPKELEFTYCSRRVSWFPYWSVLFSDLAHINGDRN